MSLNQAHRFDFFRYNDDLKMRLTILGNIMHMTLVKDLKMCRIYQIRELFARGRAFSLSTSIGFSEENCGRTFFSMDICNGPPDEDDVILKLCKVRFLAVVIILVIITLSTLQIDGFTNRSRNLLFVRSLIT